MVYDIGLGDFSVVQMARVLARHAEAGLVIEEGQVSKRTRVRAKWMWADAEMRKAYDLDNLDPEHLDTFKRVAGKAISHHRTDLGLRWVRFGSSGSGSLWEYITPPAEDKTKKAQ